MHDATTIWERVSVEELVKRRLGDRGDWGERVSLMIMIRRGRQAGSELVERKPRTGL